MEPLWSPVVATGGNQRQIVQRPKGRKEAKTDAVGCDRPPATFHGKEGVDGSSPSEGFRFLPAQVLVPFSGSATNSRFDVHPASTNVHRLLLEPADGLRQRAGAARRERGTAMLASRRQTNLRFTLVFGIRARA